MNLTTLEQLQAFTPWTWGKKPAEQGNWGETGRWRVAAKCKPLPGLMLGRVPAEHTLANPEAWAMRNQLHILDLDKCMAEDGQLLEKWQPLYSRLVDYGCPIEKSVSGEGLHAFCRIPDELAPVPQHDRKALYQLKDDLGQLFAAGGRKHRTVIMTMDWQTDSRTIPLLDGEQAAQVLMFAANYEREQKAKPMPATTMPATTRPRPTDAPHVWRTYELRTARLARYFTQKLEQGHDLTHAANWSEGSRHDTCAREFWCAAHGGVTPEVSWRAISAKAVAAGLPEKEVQQLFESACNKAGQSNV